jgi:hypothetical protein
MVKAHIIPRSFFRIVRAEAKYSVAIRRGRPEFTQAGIYDWAILCEACEPRFTPWDTYGFEVLSKNRGGNNEAMLVNGVPWAIKIRHFNYPLFQRFLLSVLWRASVTLHPFFTKVALGSFHEDRIRCFLRANDVAATDEFYPSILFLPLGAPFRPVIVTPAPVRFEHVLFYRISFPDVVAMVKVDRRKTPYPFDQIELGKSAHNVMVFQPYHSSPEQKSFEKWRKEYFRTRE